MAMFDSAPSFWRDRLNASALHLCASALIALAAAVLVFGIWYTDLYREVSGGRELFLLIVAVDVVLGPLVTLAVFNRLKPWAVLRRDLITVALLQLLALGYGLWTVFLARPVHLVFEYNRFTVVHAVEMEPAMLANAPEGFGRLPVFGPTQLSLRPFKSSQEMMESTMAALSGRPLAVQTQLWQPYEAARSEILAEAKPVAALRDRFTDRIAEIDKVLAGSGRKPDDAVFLPMTGRKEFWTVLLDANTAQVLAILPLDSF